MARLKFQCGLPLVLLLILVRFDASDAWDYGLNGKDWSSLGSCSGGGHASAQSPIDLPQSADEGHTRRMYLKYPHLGRAVSLYNNGKSIAMTMPESYKAGFGFVETEGELKSETGEVYRLWQVNFHSPSEHTIAGDRFPLEMQMVHQRVTGGKELAVISVLFSPIPGATAPFLDIVTLKGLPKSPWDEVFINTGSPPETPYNMPSNSDLGFQRVLQGSSFYAYTGSLTVPPCESNVKYFVRQQLVAAPPEHLEAFSEALRDLCPPRGNFRSMLPQTSAGFELELVSSVDALGKTESTAATPAVGTTAAPSVARPVREYILGSKYFQGIAPTDDVEMRRIKNQFQAARLRYEAAYVAHAEAVRQKKQAVDTYESIHDSAVVDKIGQKWKVIEKQNEFQAAQGELASATAKLNEHIAIAAKKLQKQTQAAYEKGTTTSITTVTTIAPLEYGSDKVATTSIPWREGDNWPPDAQQHSGRRQYRSTGGLRYGQRIELPSGLGASPFTDGVASTAVSVDGDHRSLRVGPQSSQGIFKIAPNLRQPDGPEGNVPISAESGGAAPPTLPRTPPTQMVVKLPISPHRIGEDVKEWETKLEDALASSAGVPRESIQVKEVRPYIIAA